MICAATTSFQVLLSLLKHRLLIALAPRRKSALRCESHLTVAAVCISWFVMDGIRSQRSHPSPLSPPVPSPVYAGRTAGENSIYAEWTGGGSPCSSKRLPSWCTSARPLPWPAAWVCTISAVAAKRDCKSQKQRQMMVRLFTSFRPNTR